MKQAYLSKEKIEELKEKLRVLKTEKRFEIAERLKKAKEYGDLSENFEYATVKEDQEQLEREIAQMEELIKNAQIITKASTKDVVHVGHTVTVKSSEGKKHTFTIVGSEEADPLNSRISNVSPLGRELLGKKVGDAATIKTPKGMVLEYKILSIE
jgi:transcription elongation factor GreA